MASASLSGFSMTGWNANSFRPQLPLPPVVYPPCCGKGPTFRYFMQSKILALAFIILAFASVVCFVCAFLPFWFLLKFNISDSTFGSEGLRQYTSDVGIFFYSADDYVSLLFLESMSNRHVVPGLFKVAQILEALSVAAVICSCAGACILAFRKFASMTGALFLAALSTFAALGQVLMVVFAIVSLLSSANGVCETTQSGCSYSDNQVWRNLPFVGFQDQFRRLSQHSTPKMEANWSLYIAIIGAVLSIAGCVLLWMEALSVSRKVGDIRYKQLREKRDVHEFERDPTDFIFSPPSRSHHPMYAGPPVYGGPVVSYAPPRQTYRPPPSVSGTSTQSGSAYMSREVDL